MGKRVTFLPVAALWVGGCSAILGIGDPTVLPPGGAEAGPDAVSGLPDATDATQDGGGTDANATADVSGDTHDAGAPDSGRDGGTDGSCDPLAPHSTPATTDLLLWYRFEEAAGAMMVENSQTGSWPLSVNGDQSGAPPEVALRRPGRVGCSVEFHGGQLSSASWPDVTGPFTIEFWFRPLTLPNGGGNLIHREFTGAGAYGFAIVVDGSDAIFARLWKNGVPADMGAQVALSRNTWTHIAVTFDGARGSLYVNAVLRQQAAITGPVAVGPQVLQVGPGEGVLNPNSRYTGQLDELKLWAVARSQSEVCADAAGTWTGTTCSLAPL